MGYIQGRQIRNKAVGRNDSPADTYLLLSSSHKKTRQKCPLPAVLKHRSIVHLPRPGYQELCRQPILLVHHDQGLFEEI